MLKNKNIYQTPYLGRHDYHSWRFLKFLVGEEIKHHFIICKRDTKGHDGIWGPHNRFDVWPDMPAGFDRQVKYFNSQIKYF